MDDNALKRRHGDCNGEDSFLSGGPPADGAKAEEVSAHRSQVSMVGMGRCGGKKISKNK